MRFTKMEGLGNDYIYLNCLKEVPEDLPGLAVTLSDRHFGVGADGLICIRPAGMGTLLWRCTTPTAPGEPCAATASGVWESTCTTTV